MKAVVQRVSEAKVVVDGETVGAVGQGLLVFVGMAQGDDGMKAAKLAAKIVKLRIFYGDDGRMSKSVADVGGSILLVSQFTLCADTSRGNRPGFEPAMPPGPAEELFSKFMRSVREEAPPSMPVQSGIFGADMKVSLVNDGPVTILLEV